MPHEDAPETYSVTLRRIFDAPIEIVYRAWSEADQVSRWMKCDPGVRLRLENWQPKAGREFTTHMIQEGVFESTSHGRFLEVEPPNLLVFVYYADPNLGTAEMMVRVEFIACGEQTEIVLTQSGIYPKNIVAIVESGWTNSLSMLVDIVAEIKQMASRIKT